MGKMPHHPVRIMTAPEMAEWLERNLHQVITVSQLAEHAGCSSRHLRTIFRHAFGISIRTYIQKRRLTLASLMLRETRRSLTEVAMMYQFSHLSSFSRAFKKQFRLSPRKYQQATCWDMRLFYPSAIVSGFSSHIDIVRIPGNTGIVPVSNKKKEIHFDFDFVLSTKNGRIVSGQHFYEEIISIIFRQNWRYPLTVCGETSPGKKCDTHIDMYLGQFIPDVTLQQCFIIPPGDYACFSFSGSPLNIMRFHAWVKGHGMFEAGLIMKKGITFSVFDHTALSGIFKSEYYIPCYIP
ncbi:helix-turn-helix transcriptional regulator [Salmonella enterica]|nr:helix-turn-helix transcriptional regulator [Salmonella enterica]EHO4426069.1 helix-turn-helix transcriptional regulator [Salmonella enterica]